jgi:hypothetical protein
VPLAPAREVVEAVAAAERAEALPAPPPPRVSTPAAGSEMERLRSELEAERQLVERLREAKVKLEHRVSSAEQALEEDRPRKRSSMLGRLLNPDEDK